MSVPGRYFALMIVGLFCFSLSACLGGGQAPIYAPGDKSAGKPSSDSSQTKNKQVRSVPVKPAKKDHYRVIRGDTLYSIAWRFKHDYKQIAKWNHIGSPYVIHPGQELRLIPPVHKQTGAIVKPLNRPLPEKIKAVPQSKVVVKLPEPKPVQKPVIRKEAPVPAGISAAKDKPPGKIRWQWPTRGKILTSNTASGRNGIDIQGRMGQTIKASSSGKVVYSGSGLVGYGRLIIIKHDNSFLSAYAHNSRVLVNEGNKVLAGQPIAEMGNSGTNTVKLHFEIRKDGKSVDPRQYLPK